MQKLFFGELNSNYIIWKWTLNPWGKTLISSQESHLEKMVDCKCYLDLVGLSPNLLKLGPGSIGKKKEVSQATEPRGPTGNPRCPPLRSLRVKVSHAMSSPQKCFNVCVIFMLMFKCLKCILTALEEKMWLNQSKLNSNMETSAASPRGSQLFLFSLCHCDESFVYFFNTTRQITLLYA